MYSLYVTGTDTGIGKTRVACSLLHALRHQGFEAVGMKPVASGCDTTAQGLRNEDALALQQCSDPTPSYALVNPLALPEATAPSIAAQLADIEVSLAPIQIAYDNLKASADVVVVEGVGGWLAPINAAIEQSDVVACLQLKTILVVGLKLGCIHHARATLLSLQNSSVEIIGWVCSRVDPQLAHAEAYFSALHDAMGDLPCLGDIYFDSNADYAKSAKQLQINQILQSLQE